MLMFQWNALRVGDRVMVHDDASAWSPLLEGVVVMVKSKAASNDIGVRVARSGSEHPVLRPPRLGVHLTPLDPADDCWRCDALAEQERLHHGTKVAGSR
jgi:hypothetical protein